MPTNGYHNEEKCYPVEDVEYEEGENQTNVEGYIPGTTTESKDYKIIF